MVTVSFDFSQIPAQWVARNSCGKKVVKSVGRGESPLLPRGVASFLPKSAFLSATFLISVSAFSRRGRVAVASRNDSCGKSTALGGKKKDFGRGINKYVNTFPVEEDSSKEGFIPDRRSKRSDINCFEARIGMRFSFSLPPQKVAKKQRFEDYKIRKRPFLPLINLLVETSCWDEIIYHRTSFSSPSSLFSFVTKKDSYLQDDS